jgi:hypothetical protein
VKPDQRRSGKQVPSFIQRGANLGHRIGQRTTRAHLSPIVVLFALVTIASPTQAQQAPVAQAEPQAHVVRRGDTLWDLSRMYLGTPFNWPMIHQANSGVVANPHWIYPAQRLVIPGQPGAAPAEVGLRYEPEGLPLAAGWERPERTRFYAAAELVAAEPPASEPARPPVNERGRVGATEFRGAPWVAVPEGLRLTGRLIQMGDPAGARGRLVPTLRLFEEVHMGDLTGPVVPGDSLLVARLGRVMLGLGQAVEPLGVMRVESVSGNTARLTLIRQFGDVRIGDAVLPMDALPALPVGEPQPVTGGIEGILVEFLVNHALPNTMSYAFLNVGRQHGVGIGDEFSVYIPEHEVNVGESVPDTHVATVRVIRTEDHTATVRVVAMNSTALRSGLPVRLVRRAN